MKRQQKLTRTPEQMLADIQQDLDMIVALLDDATAIQWESPHASAARGADNVSRPTENVALDTRRLAVRSATDRGLRHLVAVWQTSSRTRDQLERALERWRGDAMIQSDSNNDQGGQ